MTDLISRQAAIDAVEKSRRANCHQDRKAAAAHEYEHRHFLKILMDLPPAYPKKGKWIYTRYYTWECSECKKNPTSGMGYVQRKDELFEFCPHCGADMRGETNE